MLRSIGLALVLGVLVGLGLARGAAALNHGGGEPRLRPTASQPGYTAGPPCKPHSAFQSYYTLGIDALFLA